jgi:type IV pilus assembly protein PilW
MKGYSPIQQKGLSLVELMISLAISSLVTLGLIQMFTANQETSSLLRGQATLGESGRFAMEMLTRSVRKANYRGCNSKRALDDTIDTVPYEFSLDFGLRGFNGNADGTTSPTFSALAAPTTKFSDPTPDTNVFAPNSETLTGIDVDAMVAGTDVLTVWFAGSNDYTTDTATQPLTTGAEAILLNASTTDIANDMARYHVALINDCATENMIVITNINNVSV